MTLKGENLHDWILILIYWTYSSISWLQCVCNRQKGAFIFPQRTFLFLFYTIKNTFKKKSTLTLSMSTQKRWLDVIWARKRNTLIICAYWLIPCLLHRQLLIRVLKKFGSKSLLVLALKAVQHCGVDGRKVGPINGADTLWQTPPLNQIKSRHTDLGNFSLFSLSPLSVSRLSFAQVRWRERRGVWGGAWSGMEMMMMMMIMIMMMT